MGKNHVKDSKSQVNQEIRKLEEALNTALKEGSEEKINEIYGEAQKMLREASDLSRQRQTRLRTIKRRISQFRSQAVDSPQQQPAVEERSKTIPKKLVTKSQPSTPVNHSKRKPKPGTRSGYHGGKRKRGK